MTSSWRQQQKERLKELIYETALKLFSEQGFEKTTVQQITETAQVGKGTFFNHFPTKEHVVAEWYNRLTFESLDAVKGKSFSSALQAVCAVVDAMSLRAEDATALMDIKARIVHSSELLTDAERTQDTEISSFFLDQIAAGKKRGELAPYLDERFFCDMIVAVLTGTSRGWVTARHGFDLRRAVRERVAFLFRAAKP
ncbi:MAG: TetR/AcrR family transcriptional regulator [Planctomycetes bacterium]|nr:TetR/AcrR family transcriptional regulator [Planctomycetota bacterium]